MRFRLVLGATGALLAPFALVPSSQAADACAGPVTAIGEVQGSGAETPLAGQSRTVRGVVVGDYEGSSPALRGFYVQDTGDADPATSDAVFVFNGSRDDVASGDLVEVTGRVGEFQDQTQLSASGVTVCGAGDVTPTDVTLPLASADALERYEGMLVRLPQTLSVTEHYLLGRFGEVVVSSGGRLPQPTAVAAPGAAANAVQAANDLNRLKIDDATNRQNPDPIVFGRDGRPLTADNTLRGGDTVTGATGVLTYTWAGSSASGNAYRLRPVSALHGAATFQAANPRPAAPPAVGGGLEVASANLLNYFNTFSGCTYGVGGAPADCRGADNTTELERQTAKEVAAITSLDADVVGVMEMENDGYGADSAQAYLVDRLNAATAPGTWAFVDADAATGVRNAAGDDAIKVGVLYKPAAVTPVRTFADTGNAVWDRVPVAQTFRTAQGGTFTVVVNHLKSKGSCPADGPDADQGDGQACWNARRTAQAQRLDEWVHDAVIPGAHDPDVLLVGDFNAYDEEDPVRLLEEAGWTDLAARFHGDSAYSYVFDGQWGYLDYAFASPSLRRQVTGAADHHINADEPSVLDYNLEFKSTAQREYLYAADEFRTSDHDPVLAGLDPRPTGPRSLSRP